jgi:uncharacterized protein YkwD
MKKYFLIVLFALSSFLGYAQGVTDVINPNSFNQNFLEQLVQHKVNEYRKSQGLRPLIFDKNVYATAKDQADYIKVKNELTHDQTIRGKATVADRLRFYTKASNFSVSENIARTFVLVPNYNYDANGKASLTTAKTYEDAAIYILNSWKQSAIHNKNMTSSEYSRAAVSLYFNPKDNSITTVQVYAHYN